MADDGSVFVEHIWMVPESVPFKIRNVFSRGVVVVFAEEGETAGMTFTAAIPATHDEAMRLADLFEEGAKSGDLGPYFTMRDALCQPNLCSSLSILYKGQIDKLIEEEEREEGRQKRGGVKAVLASAARFLPKRVSNN